MHFVNIVSDAGDSAVLIPLAALLAVTLWHYESWRAASALLLSLAACAMVMVVLKLGFIACGHAWNAGLVSPSGHASMSVAVYGALGIVAAREVSGWRQPAIVLGSWVLIVGIAVSRVMLGAHSDAEVALGVFVGAAALGLFAWRYFKLRQAPVNVALLVTLSLATVIVLHGFHLPAEKLIHKLALFGRASTGVCAER